jgi:ABC-type antimicrobial peptide transport system permease subunit
MGRWGPNAYWYRIVGVAKEIRERGISIDLKPAVYLVHAQSAQAWPVPNALIVRGAADPGSLTSAVKQAIWSVDRNQAVSKIRTMDDLIGTELQSPKQNSALLAAFAGLSLLLACIGLYGVLSYAVTERTGEIGVRMALGATPGGILAMVAGRGLALVGAGLGLGLGLSLAAGKVMASLLYGVRANDPGTICGVAAILVCVAAAACLLPAHRASRLDPLIALRDE